MKYTNKTVRKCLFLLSFLIWVIFLNNMTCYNKNSNTNVKTANDLPDAPVLTICIMGWGDIILGWDDVPYADNYSVYRFSSLIIELNGSVTNIGNTTNSYLYESNLDEGIYYYVVTATNEMGTSGISNCEYVSMIWTPLESPVLKEITPNPDPDGNIILNWNDVPYTEHYRVYRHSSLITELNESINCHAYVSISIFNDYDLSEGIWYYAVTAYNFTGISEISNCVSVLVNLSESKPKIPGYSIAVILGLLVSAIAILHFLNKSD